MMMDIKIAETQVWVKRWNIPSNSDPTKTYVVAQADDGGYACSCPHWIYRRKVCKHIRAAIADDFNGIEVKDIEPMPMERFALIEI